VKSTRWRLLAATSLCACAFAGDKAFDWRAWTVGYDAKDDTQHLTEYVVQPDTVESWSELITHQRFSDPKHILTVGSLSEYFRSRLGANCPSFKWNVLEDSKSSILYEWSHDSCDSYPPQFEVSRLFKCANDFCRWAYTSKRVPIDESTRNSWRKIIRNLE
jgi:hypothetical protein